MMFQAPPAASQATLRAAPIDALRGLAMTAVIAQHCGLLPIGWMGVWLFFVVSGFVVTISVITRPTDRPPGMRLRDFFGRRARRILPVYYGYILVGLLLCLAAGKAVEPFDALSLLLFFQNIAMELGRGTFEWPSGHLWTISVEMQFYLVYGCVLILAPRPIVLKALVAAIVAAPILRLVVSVWMDGGAVSPDMAAYRIYSGSFLHIDAFAVGALLAFASRSARLDLRAIGRRLMVTGAGAMAVYVAVYAWLNHRDGAEGLDILRNIISGVLWGEYRQVWLYSALALAAGGLVALAYTRDPMVDWLLRHRWLQRIGEISYGGYVFHALCIAGVGYVVSQLFGPLSSPLVEGLLIFPIAYAMTLLAAELSFRHFESRFLPTRGGVPAARGQARLTPGVSK